MPIAGHWIRVGGMIRAGFLSSGERSALIALARDGSVTNRLARRANALVLLDGGMSCEQVAQVLFLDDDTVRRWHRAFAEGGRKALMRFAAGGSACALNDEQQAELIAWVRSTAPLDSGAKCNALKRSRFERLFQARQSRLGRAS